MTYSNDVLHALSYLRIYAQVDARKSVRDAINTLDNAGVFAALDEQSGYQAAEGIVAESAAMSATAHTNIPPAEALQVLHNTWNRGVKVKPREAPTSASVAARLRELGTPDAPPAGIRRDPSADAQAATWTRPDYPLPPREYPTPPADALAILWEEHERKERQEDDDRWSNHQD